MSHSGAFVTHLSIQRDVFKPLQWNSIIIENGLLWTLRRAKPTVDALIGIDVQHRFSFVKAIGRANDDAVLKFAAGTQLRHHHRHDFTFN